IASLSQQKFRHNDEITPLKSSLSPIFRVDNDKTDSYQMIGNAFWSLIVKCNNYGIWSIVSVFIVNSQDV
ncbi:MAG: hypothetical protein ACI3ZN_05440, partial [Candidatus Cryptobacteroides sp.]